MRRLHVAALASLVANAAALAACGAGTVVDQGARPAETSTSATTGTGAGGSGGAATTTTAVSVCEARCDWQWHWNCTRESVPTCTQRCEEKIADAGPCGALLEAAYACEQPHLAAPCNSSAATEACNDAWSAFVDCDRAQDAG
jgi:hypothetical protein